MRRCARVLAVMVWVAGMAASAAPADKTLSPYFFVEGSDHGAERFPLEKTDVRIDIAGVMAEVRVTQTYQNRGTTPLSAQYVFPASTRAAVHGMKMKIGERMVEAQVRERQQARREFDAAKKEGKSASLLEQDRPNVFRMNVSNVLPGENIEVELRYTELLVPESGIYELVFPTVVGPRYSGQQEAGEHDGFIKSPYLAKGSPLPSKLTLSGSISTGIPIDGLLSVSHAVRFEWPDPAKATFSFEPNEVQGGGNRDFILRYQLRGKAIQSGLLVHEAGDEKFFLLLVQPPKRIQPTQLPPREYVFIVDVSGSMNGFPLDTAKALLRNLASGLRPQDRFNVLLFSGGSRLLSERSLPATPENLQQALAVIDQEQGGGGTELLAALKSAMSLPRTEGGSRSFVLITDGYIGQEAASFRYVRENLGQANVFSFGIGQSVNRYLIEGVARAGMGEPFVVTSPKEAPAVSARFLEYVRSPVLTGLKLEAEGVQLSQVEPPSLPDVLAERPVVVFGKWKGNKAGVLRLTGNSGAGEFRAEHPLATAQRDAKALPYLWARTRIAQLSNSGEDLGSAAAAEETLALGLRYNLLTRYTSFIAVLHEKRTQSPALTDTKQPLPLPEGVENSAVGETMAVGDEPELFWLMTALAVAFAAVTFARRRVA